MINVIRNKIIYYNLEIYLKNVQELYIFFSKRKFLLEKSVRRDKTALKSLNYYIKMKIIYGEYKT